MGKVIITSAALAEGAGGMSIIRGQIKPVSLREILLGRYQREPLLQKQEAMARALLDSPGCLPDVELALRGDADGWESGPGKDSITLNGEVYAVDGQQRRGGCLIAQKEYGIEPRLGAAIYLGTTEDWEAERFKLLNLGRTKVAPSVILRNMSLTSPVIKTLYALSENDSDFVLRNRVTWTQKARVDELITGMVYMRMIGVLHSHIGPGRSVGIDALVAGMERIHEAVGQRMLRENVRTFFALMSNTWGPITPSTERGDPVYLKGLFLLTVARILSGHLDFWEGNRLVVPPKWEKRFKRVKINKMVEGLAGANNQAIPLLRTYILDQGLHHGLKPEERLKPREISDSPSPEGEDAGEVIE